MNVEKKLTIVSYKKGGRCGGSTYKSKSQRISELKFHDSDIEAADTLKEMPD